MLRCKPFVALAAALTLIAGWQIRATAEEIPEKYKESIRKGLDWIAKNQQKDGHWAANGDHHPVAMTGLAGVALLMEGSTVRDGRYAINIRKAADWLMERSQKGQRNGLIGNPDHPSEQGRYMYGHGFGMLFLASVYGEEDDRERREKLKDILTRAARYTGDAQSTHGGWFYNSAKDGHDSDEGSVTVTQMQALRACRDAGISVNKDIMKKGHEYLKKSTTQRGGVVYSLGRGGIGGAPLGGERPALTAAAIACVFSAGEYKDEYVKKWWKFCADSRMHEQGGFQGGHDEYTQFYLAPSIYFLGEDGFAKMFPDWPADKRVTWSKYRAHMFERLAATQGADGSWPAAGGWSVGPVFSTSVACCMMQLDNNMLPVFQR